MFPPKLEVLAFLLSLLSPQTAIDYRALVLLNYFSFHLQPRTKLQEHPRMLMFQEQQLRKDAEVPGTVTGILFSVDKEN